MTKARSWPNAAEWARQDCLSLARRGRAILVETLDVISDPAVMRRIAKATEAFREIEAKLIQAKGNDNG